MTDKDIEKRLYEEVSAEAPDVLDKILARCGEQETPSVTEISAAREKKNHRPLAAILASAAALALIVIGALSISNYNAAHRVDTLVSLDVNPSVEISANAKEIVLAVKAVNDDAAKELEGTDFTGETLEEAAKGIVLRLAADGYISSDANSVLLTVKNSDEAKAEDIEARLSSGIADALSSQGIESSIIGQVITGSVADISITGSAEIPGVSEGKALLAEKIAQLDPTLDTSELVKLPINDLGILADAEAGEDGLEGVVKIGSTADGKYIGVDGAVTATGANAGINVLDIVSADVSVGVEDGKLVYNVDIKTNLGEITSVVDAVTGGILDAIGSALTGGSDKAEAPEENTSDIPAAQAPSSVVPAAEAPAAPSSTPTPTVDSGISDIINDGISDGIGKVNDGIQDGLSKVSDGISYGLDEVNNQIDDGIGKVTDIVNDAIGDYVPDSVTDTISDTISDVVDGVIGGVFR